MALIDEKYEIVRELGAGAMGAVYEARHVRTQRRVAIKVIKEEAKLDPGVVERFHREARAAGAIESEHITEVLDSGVDAGDSPYLVMEFLSGEDLDAALKRVGPMKPDVAARIVAQMLMGLERAHEAGVVHRDIKPANVFLAKEKREGGTIVVKVSDFGIAKVKADPLAGNDRALTHTSALLGSPAYMSPEQAKGAKDIDARADLWSTAIVLYQLLSGDTPHPTADTLGLLLLAICSEEAPWIQTRAPWVPASLAAILAKALKLEIAERYQSAREMLVALIETLPDGTALDEAMIVPLTDEERFYVAPSPPAPASPALDATIRPTPSSAPGAYALASSSGERVLTATTGAGVTKSPAVAPEVTPPPRKRGVLFAAVLAAGAIAVGGVAFAITSGVKEHPTPVGLASVTTPPAAADVSAPAVTASEIPSAPPSLTVIVDAAPPKATVSSPRIAVSRPAVSATAVPKASAATTTTATTAAPSSSVFREFR